MKSNRYGCNHKPQWTTRRFLQSCALPLLTVMVWAGCKPEAKVAGDTKSPGPTPAGINAVGTYTLVSVDGKQLPCTLQHGGQSPTIKSGSFIINADGTCSSKVDFSLPSGGDTCREVKASYTQEGSTLTMKWQGAGTTLGTVEGDAFTMNNEGMIFAYRK